MTHGRPVRRAGRRPWSSARQAGKVDPITSAALGGALVAEALVLVGFLTGMAFDLIDARRAADG